MMSEDYNRNWKEMCHLMSTTNITIPLVKS